MSFMAKQSLLRAEQNIRALKKIYFNNATGDWADETAGLVVNTLDHFQRAIREVLNLPEQEVLTKRDILPDKEKEEKKPTPR